MYKKNKYNYYNMKEKINFIFLLNFHISIKFSHFISKKKLYIYI